MDGDADASCHAARVKGCAHIGTRNQTRCNRSQAQCIQTDTLFGGEGDFGDGAPPQILRRFGALLHNTFACRVAGQVDFIAHHSQAEFGG